MNCPIGEKDKKYGKLFWDSSLDIQKTGGANAMRKKEQKLVITFHTTADAMAMEDACRKQAMQGRLIPVPKEISAGCGLAWCADLEIREDLKYLMQQAGICGQGIYECMV